MRCPLPTVGTFCPPPPPGTAHFLGRSGQGNLSRAVVRLPIPERTTVPCRGAFSGWCLGGEGKQSESSHGEYEGGEHSAGSAPPPGCTQPPAARSSCHLQGSECHLPSCPGLAGQERREGCSHHCPRACWCLEGWLVPSTKPPLLWEAGLPLLVLGLAKTAMGLSACPGEHNLVRSALCSNCSAWYEGSGGAKGQPCAEDTSEAAAWCGPARGLLQTLHGGKGWVQRAPGT